MACKFWSDKYNVGSAMYTCPTCERELKSKLSNSEKNPGRVFVSCSKDFGGCGLFSFIDEEPRFVKPKASAQPSPFKRTRLEEAAAAGTNLVGPVANAPAAHETRLADLTAEVAGLRSEVAKLAADFRTIADYVKETTDH